MEIIGVVIVLVVLGLILIPQTIYSVKQQTNVIIERFGRFHKIQQPGLRTKIPFIDKKAGTSDLRVQQLDLNIETKTQDNVFVVMAVSVQYQINPQAVYDSFYKLSDHRRQMSSYVFDTIRASVPKLTLDETFEKKDEIADDVSATIGKQMSEFGYDIVNTLISDINPDEKVKAAMNEINAAQRKRQASQALAEADKIMTVTQAQAKAEAQRLQGEGISNQRREIIKGFADSFNELQDTNISHTEATNIILFTQYLDTLAIMGENGTNSIMLPSGPSGAADMFSSIQNSILTGTTAAESINSNIKKQDNLAVPKNEQ